MDVCKYCQSGFITKDALKNHLLTEHLEYSRKKRFEFYQSLFKINKSDKAERKINKKISKSKGDKKTKRQIKYKFDKRYKGVLYGERVRCDHCKVIYDKYWHFKNTNVCDSLKICINCELKVNVQKDNYVRIIYNSIESKR